MTSPRSKGFNYGGGGMGPEEKKSLEILGALPLADLLREKAQEASKVSWKLDHALWVLRCVAETEAEKSKALTDIADIVHNHRAAASPGEQHQMIADHLAASRHYWRAMGGS